MRQFLKMIQEIKKYVGRTYKDFTGELTEVVKELELEDPVAPVDRNPVNPPSRSVNDYWLGSSYVASYEYSMDKYSE